MRLSDAGPKDAKTGDGLYTAAFTHAVPGMYTALAKVHGTAGGNAFARSSETTFQVNPPTAFFISFEDHALDDNANGATDSIVTKAIVSVVTPGIYEFRLRLKGRNGKSISASSKASLPAGISQISAPFPAKWILADLGVDGPYERVNASLVYLPPGADTVAADYRPRAGFTAPFVLGLFDRGDPLE